MSDQTPHGLNPILGKVWTHHDGVLPDGAVCRIADAQALIATLTARCEALTAERNNAQETLRIRLREFTDGHCCHQCGAQLETTPENDIRCPECDDKEKVFTDLRSRCQHLEQAVRKVRAHTGYLPSASYLLLAGLLASIERIADAALASLLPTQEEPTQTDENRVSFAAGYSQALDDAVKGKS